MDGMAAVEGTVLVRPPYMMLYVFMLSSSEEAKMYVEALDDEDDIAYGKGSLCVCVG